MENDAALTSTPFVEWLEHVGIEGFSLLAEQLWEEVPALHESPPGTREALRESVVSHIPGLRSTFSARDEGPSTLPDAAFRFVEHMAAADAPLTAILRSYEVGHASIWNGYTRYLREAPLALSRRADELESASMRMFEYMQAMTRATVIVYHQVRDALVQERESRRTEVVKAALRGELSAAELLRHLGYRADETHVGYVAWSDDGRAPHVGESVRRAIAPMTRQHLSVPDGVSGVHGWVSLISSSAYAQLREIALPPGVHVAFGAPRNGLEGFRHTHDEARLSARMPTSVDAQVCFPDAAVAILMTQQHDLARRFVEDHLGALLHHGDRDRLLTTLHHYVETLGSPSRCGRRLGVHANTVTQRIRRIEDILDRPVDPESLPLRVALVVRPAIEAPHDWPIRDLDTVDGAPREAPV